MSKETRRVTLAEKYATQKTLVWNPLLKDFDKVDVPLYNPELHKFNNPQEFREILKGFTFTREFVDWVAEKGYRVIYKRPKTKPRATASVYFDTKLIVVRSPYKHIKRQSLAHELIHIAIPDKRLSMDIGIYTRHTIGTFWDYEAVIEERSVELAKDDAMMKYIEAKIPVVKTRTRWTLR